MGGTFLATAHTAMSETSGGTEDGPAAGPILLDTSFTIHPVTKAIMQSRHGDSTHMPALRSGVLKVCCGSNPR